MIWYAAHIVISMNIIDKSNDIEIYENIFLVQEKDEERAMIEAERIGRSSAINDPSFTIEGKPAQMEFLGVRKLVKISNNPPLNQYEDRPISGSEISYLRYRMPNREQIKEWLSGSAVDTKILE